MTSTSRTARVVGRLRRLEDGRGAVRMEDLYDTDVDDLWSAVTDPRRLARWVAQVDGDLHVGGLVHARFTSGWDGPGRIDVCEAPRRLVVTLAPGTPEETVVEATVAAEEAGSRLVVEERGLLLGELPAHGAGWQAHVEDLGAHLEGRRAGDWHARWTALTPTYRDLAVDPA
jgi:uncharacterized protein YndB with AHSA1/START domain